MNHSPFALSIFVLANYQRNVYKIQLHMLTFRIPSVCTSFAMLKNTDILVLDWYSLVESNCIIHKTALTPLWKFLVFYLSVKYLRLILFLLLSHGRQSLPYRFSERLFCCLYATQSSHLWHFGTGRVLWHYNPTRVQTYVCVIIMYMCIQFPSSSWGKWLLSPPSNFTPKPF